MKDAAPESSGDAGEKDCRIAETERQGYSVNTLNLLYICPRVFAGF